MELERSGNFEVFAGVYHIYYLSGYIKINPGESNEEYAIIDYLLYSFAAEIL